jgi:Na+/H+-dicarboxylate symporter
VVKREPPELTVKLGPLLVVAKGVDAVRAVRWPVAVAIMAVVPLVIFVLVYGVKHLGDLRPLLRRWWY